MRTLIAAVGLVGLFGGSALAGPYAFNDFTTTTPDGANVSLALGSSSTKGSPVGQEFNVTAATSLTSVTLRLSDSTSDTGSVLVYLVPDNGSSLPTHTGGDTLTNATLLGTILDSTINSTSTAGGCSFGASPQISLCNTKLNTYAPLSVGDYWIVLAAGNDPNNGNSNAAATTALWWRDTDNISTGGGVGTAGMDRISTANSTVSNGFTTGQMEMQVTTPEPASMAVLGASLFGLGFARRRQQRKNRT